MQKIRIFFTYLTLFILLWSSILPVGMTFGWEDKYDYSEYFDKINISSNDRDTSLFEGSIDFESDRTTFILAFDGYTPTSSEDIEVIWNVNGVKYARFLDIEGPDDLSRITTFPLVIGGRKNISYEIRFHTRLKPESILLISSNQESQGKRRIFLSHYESLSAQVEEGIVSREAWGADETLRYVSPDRTAQKIKEWEARGRTPLLIEETPEERSRRIKSESEYNAITSLDPESTTTYAYKRYERGNKLSWPIKKSKKINRIVLHHTAESLEKTADDMTLIRAIYFYHTRTKGWGDIGYNFIVGQRGKIYEGRAGGDYVEGAHVYGNNLGTVGISLIGNYENLHLNKEQKEGLLQAIEYVVRKYGIDLTESSYGASLCGNSLDCTWKKVTTPKLIGHRDLAATSCPGKNLYSQLEDFRKIIVGKVGKVQSVYNTENSTIDPVSPEDEIEYTLGGRVEPPMIMSSNITPPIKISSTKKKEKSLLPNIASLLQNPKITPPSVSKLPLGPEVKIKLSYPTDKNAITLESATRKNAIFLIGKRRIALSAQSRLEISLSGSHMLQATLGNKKYVATSFSVQGDVIRVPSWSRIPSWDTTGKYNDNIFRGRITIRNEGGKLLIINELPLENYLKGMGEVSESVDVKNYPEKVKALIVAGRSYVSYYQNPRLPLKDRKFQTRLYDISDNPDESQVYKGYGYEMRSPNYAKLVESTSGEVVKYNGELIKVWYFSSSDGRTLSYKEYCESRGIKNCKDIPYLQSVPDPAGVGKVRAGHGVGISGIGATYAATNGKNYKDIIAYYMKGVTVEKIR